MEWISNKTLGEQERQWVKEFLVFHGFPKVALSITMGIHVTAVLSHGPQKNDFPCLRTQKLRPKIPDVTVEGKGMVKDTYMSRCWFQRFFISTPTWGMIQFDEYFSDGLKPPTRCLLFCNLCVCVMWTLVDIFEDLGLGFDQKKVMVLMVA